MSNIDTTDIQAKIDKKKLLLAAYEAAELAFVENSAIKRYVFDSGMGRQSVERRSPKEMHEVIYGLEREIEYLETKLVGRGLINGNYRNV